MATASKKYQITVAKIIKDIQDLGDSMRFIGLKLNAINIVISSRALSQLSKDSLLKIVKTYARELNFKIEGEKITHSILQHNYILTSACARS